MSATVEEKKLIISVKPIQDLRNDHNRAGKDDRHDRNNNNSRSNSNRGYKRDGYGSFGGNQRFGGYRRAGGNLNHTHKDNKTYQQRQQPSEDNAGFSGGRNIERFFYDKLKEIVGPTNELPVLECVEKKFSGRCRLYLGNIPPSINEADIKELMKDYGEISDVFLNREKKFSFVRMDYHYNAEKAKNDLNGKAFKNYTLKVRFAPHGATIKVKNLDEHVSNELLNVGFSVFGDIDRAVVSLDDRGKPTGEGIVEFARKNSALLALRKCTEGCYFLTNNIRPVMVELYETCDDQDGHSDRFMNKNNPDYQKSRSVGPRLAHVSSFEHAFGMRWKQLYELHKRKQDALNKELDIEKNKLIAQMEYARYEHETAMLREELRAREMDMDRQKRQWEQKQTQVEEERRKADDYLRRQQDRMQSRMVVQTQVVDLQQQETKLFLQAQQLTNMLECQEKSYYASGDINMQNVGGAVLMEVATRNGGGGDGPTKNDVYSSLGKRRRY